MDKNNCDSDNNLTTDAHPSPPRVDNFEIPETKDEEERKPKIEPKIRSSKPKKKKKVEDFATATNTTVINIQGGSGIRIGHNYTYYVGNSEKSKNDVVVKTVGIAKLLKRTDEVKKTDILLVSQYVGENWKVVARILGFSEGEIFQFCQDMKDTTMKEVIYQILLGWIQNKPEEAQYGNLFTALWNAKEREAVKKMADYLETNQL